MIRIWHPIAKVEILLTRAMFERIMDLLRAGITHPDYYYFLRPYWERFYKQYPFSSWLQWILYAIEHKWYELEFRQRFYRMQCAVLFYTKYQSDKTPNPFLEARAWTIVPEWLLATKGVRYVYDVLERESAWLPWLIGSIYVAFGVAPIREKAELVGRNEIAKVGKKYCSYGTEKLLLPMVNIVPTLEPIAMTPRVIVAYEVREIDKDYDEITVEEANCARNRVCRGIAIYKYDRDTWRNAHAKYPEAWVTTVEDLLMRTKTMQNFRYGRYKGLVAFKKFCVHKLYEIMTALEANNDYQAQLAVNEIYEIMLRAYQELYGRLIPETEDRMLRMSGMILFPWILEYERGVEL